MFEISCQRLDATLRGRFVEEHHTALRIVFLAIESSKVLIEAAADLLERNLGDVLS
jgi:hypothetical protein